MNLKFKISVATLGCLLFGAAACVKQDPNFGYSFIPEYERFITKYVDIPLDSIYVSTSDSLDAFNSQRFTIGAISDADFGLNRHVAAFSIIPMQKDMNWGKNVRNVSMHFGAKKDTVSYKDESRAHIIQNVRVYSLRDPKIKGQASGIVLDTSWKYTSQLTKDMFSDCTPISKGVPTYDGRDSLSFDFTSDFASKFLVDDKGEKWDGRTQSTSSASDFAKTYPGVFLCMDDPEGHSGRINMFKSRAEINSDNYLTGSFIELKFRADYNDRIVDTSFFYALGATSIFSANEAIEFMAFNCSEHESKILAETGRYGKACHLDGKQAYLTDDKLYVEGGSGLKPMIRAIDMRKAVAKAIADTLKSYGINDVEKAMQSKNIFINKAQLILPYRQPQEYKTMSYYPKYLNPTIRVISESKDIVYAAITDALVKDENQGIISYDTQCYCPDIANHLQEILGTDPVNEPDKIIRENLWLNILADETITTTKVSSSTDNEAQLAYLNYYYSMLSGNYNGTSSYYNYYLMQSMLNNTNSSDNNTSVQTTAPDYDRYYNAVLTGYGDKSAQGRPKIKLVYSFLRPEATN